MFAIDLRSAPLRMTALLGACNTAVEMQSRAPVAVDVGWQSRTSFPSRTANERPVLG
jgi:hypothetical protein